ncbi:hypothetical protein NC651_037072 [Populus alba x Populus x berolinensis]|nr:hypothetical protein NC651_037072 [Populus alba x Populus x berolinensis]
MDNDDAYRIHINSKKQMSNYIAYEKLPDLQYGYKVSQSISTEEYRDVESELILNNCLNERAHFVANPRASSSEPLLRITIQMKKRKNLCLLSIFNMANDDAYRIHINSKEQMSNYIAYEKLPDLHDVESELILNNCLNERADFVASPHASSSEPLPRITIRTLEDLQTEQDCLGIKNFIVVVPLIGGDWDSGGTCNGETEPVLRGSILNNYPVKMKIVEEVIQEMKNPVTLLNVTSLTNFRKDGHPSIFGKNVTAGMKVSSRRQDCSHWCLPGVPDAWNELIYATLVQH